jgi:general secretion pathway protein L
MTRLVVTVPESWRDATCAVAWALVRDGSLVREGSGLIADLPAAARVSVIVAASRVLLASATLPRRGARRVQHALAYAVEDQLTSDPEGVHAVAAGAPRDNRQSIAVIEREWLRNLLASFQSAKARPDSVTVESCLPPIAEGEWKVVLRRDGGFARTGDAAGISFDGALEGAAPDVLRLALDAARGEGSGPRRIAVHAESALDVQSWGRELGVPCEAAGPWHAWRSVERPSVEFLQGEFKRRFGSGDLWPRLRPAAILAGAALAIEVVGTFCQWGALRYEKVQLEARMQEQFKAAFPTALAIVDPALQMRRNLQAARAAAGMAQESDFLPLLAKAARANAGGGWIVKTVGYDTGKLSLDVVFADRGRAASTLKRLQDRDIGVALEAASPQPAGAEERVVLVPRAPK